MTTVERLEQLKDYFHLGSMMFTDDSEERGIDNRLIEKGFRLDMNIPRPVSGMWFLNRKPGEFMRYHPITDGMPHLLPLRDEGLVTRMDFIAGTAPIMYDVSTALLDSGFRVGVVNLGGMLQDVSVFRKQGELYIQEKVINLS